MAAGLGGGVGGAGAGEKLWFENPLEIDFVSYLARCGAVG